MFNCKGANVNKACADIKLVNYKGAGAFTYGVEGAEGGPYASRYLHVPSPSSGLTLGRGYDMKDKTFTKIKNDLIKADIKPDQAEKIAKAAGKKGGDAEDIISNQTLGDFSIEPEQQNKLFKIAYEDAEKDVKRISGKDDVVSAYGATDFESLNPAIKEILVDLRFRGDYTGTSRKSLQPAIVSNNVSDFKKAVADLKGIPKDRMLKRLEYLDSALAEEKKNQVQKPFITQPPTSIKPLTQQQILNMPSMSTPPPLRKGGQAIA